MKDRIPAEGKAGRMLITPENGTPFYATVTMADEPLQEGTPLNKATLLKDTTAALLGGNASMVPDEAFVVLKASIDEVDALVGTKAKIETGTYKGSNGFGSSSKNSLTFSFVPKLVVVVGQAYYNSKPQNGECNYLVLAPQSGYGFGALARTSDQSTSTIKAAVVSISGNTVSWYSYKDAASQCNSSSVTYTYVAIG